MTPAEHFQAGQLDDAIAAANQAVKASPTDVAARSFLCELLCFAGELERADKLLDVIGTQDPDAMMGVSEFRQLIRGELARREVFAQGRSPEFVRDPTPAQRASLEVLLAMRNGDSETAIAKLDVIETELGTVTGTHDGEPFDELRDLDEVIAGSLEVLTSTGEYHWVSFSDIASLSFTPPSHARDLLWRRAEISVRGGLDGVVHVPVLYIGAHEESDDQLRLGRGTDWRNEETDPVRGVGQRMLLVGEEDVAVMSLGTLEFDEPA